MNNNEYIDDYRELDLDECKEGDSLDWVVPIKEVCSFWMEREGCILRGYSWRIPTNFVDKNSFNVKGIGKPSFSNQRFEIMGNAKLINSSNEPQHLITGSFTKTIESRWSTTTMNTRNFGMEIEAKINFGSDFFRTEFRIQYNMDFSYSKSVTRGGSESLSYKLEPQTILVPPNSTRYVYASLDRSTATLPVEMMVNFTCFVYASGRQKMTGADVSMQKIVSDLVEEVNQFAPHPELKPVSQPKYAQMVGTGKIVLDAAFDVIVEVREKPMENGGKILDRYNAIAIVDRC